MNDVELVPALLGSGADPEARDAVHGTRPYEWAAWAVPTTPRPCCARSRAASPPRASVRA